MRLRLVTRITIVAAFAAAAFAQGPGGQGFGGGQGRGQGGPGGGVDRIAEQLSLKGDQKTKIQGILDAQREAMMPMQQEMMQLQGDMQTAVRAGDKAKIQTVSEAIGKIQGKLAAARAMSDMDIYAVLTDKQKKQAVEAFPMGFSGGGMGGFGGGRRPQQQ